MSTSVKTAGVSMLRNPPLLQLLLLLPQEILIEILSQLPTKSLVRLRCVSKSFCTLIADHGFGVLQRSLSLTLPSRAGILISISARSSPVYYTINFSEKKPWRPGMLQANSLANLDSEPLLKGSLRSSSDGLICLSRPIGDVVVCNVSTGQRISLPRIQFSSACCARVGFDSQSQRYKVLMTACQRTRRRGSRQICFEYNHWILTVGVDKSWREVNYSSLPFYPFDANGCPGYSDTSVHIDGVIYQYNWLTRDDPPSFDIVAFEVGSESYAFIPIPPELPSSSQIHSIDAFGEKYHYSGLVLRNFALLQVYGGQLAIVYVHKIRHLYYMDVWTWKKSEERWGKMTVPIPCEESRKIKGFEYVRYSTNHAGEIVLLCINTEKLFILVCNLKSKVLKTFDVGGVEFPICFPRDVRMYKTMDNVFSIE
ncbi:putative F-box protein At3g52320 [Ipomoea triloba]|uniref:putative F-box protein At3g52320 n=1 Tax=Ipomoea triloba TaxID=35885 RepID=UPI00125D68A2|nr:putative F-box protein At3g52320 [Ipomoea triloba]